MILTRAFSKCSSRLSATYAAEAREAVLAFFRAPPSYAVIFTADATGALKLVGEAFPFAEGSAFVLGADSHNSVHGIRQYATRRGAQVHYIESTPQGGVDPDEAKVYPFHPKLIIFCLTSYSLGYSRATPSIGSKHSIFVRPYRAIKRVEFQESAFPHQTRGVLGILHASRRRSARPNICDVINRNTGRRNGYQLL